MQGENSMERAKDLILAASLPHVPFDGWSAPTFQAALADSGVAPGLGAALFPRGGIDLAVAYHQGGDAAMRDAYDGIDKAGLRIRDRIALALRLRLQLADKELVRRGSALFGLPHHALEGSRLIWGSADAIWNALGDTSRDLNWYTKRATLSAVYAATVLFWLGDTSEGDADTWAFLDRRIDNVMQFEKAKAGLRDTALGKALLGGPLKILERVHAPAPQTDLPGQTH